MCMATSLCDIHSHQLEHGIPITLTFQPCVATVDVGGWLTWIDVPTHFMAYTVMVIVNPYYWWVMSRPLYDIHSIHSLRGVEYDRCIARSPYDWHVALRMYPIGHFNRRYIIGFQHAVLGHYAQPCRSHDWFTYSTRLLPFLGEDNRLPTTCRTRSSRHFRSRPLVLRYEPQTPSPWPNCS